MTELINELRYLKSNCKPNRNGEALTEANQENSKKFQKVFMKAAKLYADFYSRDISEGMLYVSAQLR